MFKITIKEKFMEIIKREKGEFGEIKIESIN